MNLADIEIENAEESKQLIARLLRHFAKDKPKILRVVVSEKVHERSINQNKALFGHAYKIINDDMDAGINDLHHHFCCEYFGRTQVELGGKVYERPTRTTTTNEAGRPEKISTNDFVRLFEFVQLRAYQDWGIVIPDPDPDWKQKANAQIEREST